MALKDVKSDSFTAGAWFDGNAYNNDVRLNLARLYFGAGDSNNTAKEAIEGLSTTDSAMSVMPYVFPKIDAREERAGILQKMPDELLEEMYKLNGGMTVNRALGYEYWKDGFARRSSMIGYADFRAAAKEVQGDSPRSVQQFVNLIIASRINQSEGKTLGYSSAELEKSNYELAAGIPAINAQASAGVTRLFDLASVKRNAKSILPFDFDGKIDGHVLPEVIENIGRFLPDVKIEAATETGFNGGSGIVARFRQGLSKKLGNIPEFPYSGTLKYAGSSNAEQVHEVLLQASKLAAKGYLNKLLVIDSRTGMNAFEEMAKPGDERKELAAADRVAFENALGCLVAAETAKMAINDAKNAEFFAHLFRLEAAQWLNTCSDTTNTWMVTHLGNAFMDTTLRIAKNLEVAPNVYLKQSQNMHEMLNVNEIEKGFTIPSVLLSRGGKHFIDPEFKDKRDNEPKSTIEGMFDWEVSEFEEDKGSSAAGDSESGGNGKGGVKFKKFDINNFYIELKTVTDAGLNWDDQKFRGPMFGYIERRIAQWQKSANKEIQKMKNPVAKLKTNTDIVANLETKELYVGLATDERKELAIARGAVTRSRNKDFMLLRRYDVINKEYIALEAMFNSCKESRKMKKLHPEIASETAKGLLNNIENAIYTLRQEVNEAFKEDLIKREKSYRAIPEISRAKMFRFFVEGNLKSINKKIDKTIIKQAVSFAPAPAERIL